MSGDRCELLIKLCHFSNNEKKQRDQDKLFKMKPLLYVLKDRFQSIYVRGSPIPTDKTMVLRKGSFLFKQYIPGQGHKYG